MRPCGVSVAATLLFAAWSTPANACIWDSDTLRAEARGLPNAVAIIVGRFERQPPRYYEMRLERVTDHLREHPDDLAAYDDAAVACDRLGRGDEAIDWMEKKNAVLDQADPSDAKTQEHRYRYLANTGTFWVHRWFRQGADRAKLDEVRTARDFIAQAIELNPDAHFGREKYQLRAMDLILRDHKPVTAEDSFAGVFPSLLDTPERRFEPPYGSVSDTGMLQERGLGDAIQGLSGLVVLGNAWESVDVYYALSLALQADGRSSLAYLASARVKELIHQGHGSLVEDAPAGSELEERLNLYHPVDDHGPSQEIDAFYREARAAADQWQQNRWAFMEAQFDKGKHPDTGADFWDGWNDKPPLPPLPAVSGMPDLVKLSRQQAFRVLWGIGVSAFAVLAVGSLILILVVRQLRTSWAAETKEI